MKRTSDGLQSIYADNLQIKKSKFLVSNNETQITFPSGSYTVAKLSDIGGELPENVLLTDEIQTVTNKDLTSSTNTFPTDILRTTSIQTVTNKDLTSSTNTFPTDILRTTSIQTVTNKDLTSSTNTFPTDILRTTSNQTVTNKDLTSSTNTFPADIVRTTENDAITITNMDQSSNSSTGALVIGGGLGVGKNVHVNGTIHVPKGTANSPSFSFSDDNKTGIYSASSSQLNLTTNGVNRVNVGTSSLTTSLPLVVPSGTSLDCAVQISGSAGCGLYSNGLNTLNFATSGVERMNITSSGYVQILYGQLVLPTGSVTTPSISWPGTSVNSGIYLVGTDNVGFSANGGLVADFNATRWGYTIPITLPTSGGTASNLDYYEEYTHSSSWTYSGATIPSFNFLCRRIGKMVSIQLTTMGVAYRNTGGASKLTLTTALPTRFRPSETIYKPISIEVNANTSHRTIAINSTGVIEIGEVNTSVFAINTDLRVLACSYTFNV